MATYTGELDVKPNVFFMSADRFIVRDNEVSFDFRYREGHEAGVEEHLDAVAKRQPEGYYKRDKIGYDNDQSIYIIKAKASKSACIVEGFWLNSEGAWRFSGRLRSSRPAMASPLDKTYGT